MPKKNKEEYNEYIRDYMRGYRAKKKSGNNMSGGEWKTRKRGTPAQRGTRFRTGGISGYQAPTPVGNISTAIKYRQYSSSRATDF